MTPEERPSSVSELPEYRSVLAVCAHPDDESFGLGAALARFAERGSAVSVLCFTHGEASTLGASVHRDLAAGREHELARAAAVLGIGSVRLLGYPDGALADEQPEALADHVSASAGQTGAGLLVVFDEGGITGHPDHIAATQAALAAAARLRVPVLAWALEEAVAEGLSRAFGAQFVGRAATEVDIAVRVDRQKQHKAIACHESQATDNPVLARRLALQGEREVFRWLRLEH